MTQYIKINGITGNVAATGYEGCIEAYAIQQIAHRFVKQQVGSPNRDVGAIGMQHLQIHKRIDASSAQLNQYFLSGATIEQMEINRCSLCSGNPEWQSKIVLHNVLISGVEEYSNADGGSEIIKISFSKMEKSYRTQNSNGSWQSPNRTGYNLETAETI
jgi:type VI protein secretion system component Hcp